MKLAYFMRHNDNGDVNTSVALLSETHQLNFCGSNRNGYVDALASTHVLSRMVINQTPTTGSH